VEEKPAMKKIVGLFTGLLGVVLVAGVAYAAAPPKDVAIDLVKGDKGAVTLPHEKHATFKHGGKAVTCKDCHHTLKADAPAAGEAIAKCETCHQLDTPKTVDGKVAPVLAKVTGGKAELKSVLFHAVCMDSCHKEVKTAADGVNLTKCDTCHKKA
jgi:hypothetical protein